MEKTTSNKKETKEKVLSSFKKAMKDIKSGKVVKNSISSKVFFKKFLK